MVGGIDVLRHPPVEVVAVGTLRAKAVALTRLLQFAVVKVCSPLEFAGNFEVFQGKCVPRSAK